mgnify:CR=1 FL=1
MISLIFITYKSMHLCSHKLCIKLFMQNTDEVKKIIHLTRKLINKKYIAIKERLDRDISEANQL